MSQHEITTQLGITTTQFSWLNSAGSLVSIVAAPICGPLMDKYSSSMGALLGVCIILLSQVVAMLALEFGSFAMLILSKLMFGLGF